MTIGPTKQDGKEETSPSIYVLLVDGTVIQVNAGQVVHLKGLNHPIFGQSYAIASVPKPDGKGNWLLLGHLSGLMVYQANDIQ